jgi:hypothetical protein
MCTHCKSETAIFKVKPVRKAERAASVKKPVHLFDDDTDSDHATAKSPRSAPQLNLDKKYRLASRLDQKKPEVQGKVILSSFRVSLLYVITKTALGSVCRLFMSSTKFDE